MALLFNSIGALFAASSMLTYAQGFADEDKVLICSGSTYQWMSLSTFELTGKVEYVDAPENAPSNLQEIKCSYAYLADPNPDTPWLIAQVQPTFPLRSNITIDYFNALYTTARHQLALTRAPPTFS
jgi:hypothetical protein